MQPISKGLTIGVGPIRFPDYLDRPGIVTRSSGNTIEIAEFDLWAGSLKDDFMRILAENLSILLGTEKMFFIRISGTFPRFQNWREFEPLRGDSRGRCHSGGLLGHPRRAG